ncbi:MAG: hypothetical protein NBKEAIPA_01960 [Nitrospirae bacterium]|nr:hypothetical protein [Nitrospirota bacterium]MCE7964942.1 hypothetical protein [Nitrospira sp. NTP2]
MACGMNNFDPPTRRGAAPPFWSIALAAAVIILTPMILYSVAPEGPIREGDTVFSNGAHKVPLYQSDRYQEAGYASTCLLDPKDPLIVTHSPENGADDTLIAQVQGKSTIEWPFCPPQAELLLKRHHVTQQPSLLQDMKDGLQRLLRRS